MTEAEWSTNSSPLVMLPWLGEHASDRKLRLFTAACCRQIWTSLEDGRTRLAVELAEKYADGNIDARTLTEAVRVIPMPQWTGEEPEMFNWKLLPGAVAADMTDPTSYVWLTGELHKPDLTLERVAALWGQHGTHLVSIPTQSDLFRCIFGNPFRPVAFDPSWRSETAVALAAGIYEKRAFDRLPILADALEEAGCDNPDVLNHLRGPGPHARGCWVVDGLLGKS